MAIVSHKHKFIFIKVPKTGGTTQRWLWRQLQESIDLQGPLDQKDVSLDTLDWGVWYQHCTSKKVKEWFKENNLSNGWGSYFKFGFVRNPWDREVSGYFASKENNKEWMKTFPNQTFSEFLDFAPCSHMGERGKGQQHEYLTEVDYIAKFEKYDEETKYIWKTIGLENDPIDTTMYRTRKPRNKNIDKPYWKYYNDVDVMRVHEAYKNDIEIFNYEFGDNV